MRNPKITMGGLAVAALLAVAGCGGTAEQTRRTVTVVDTVTSGSAASSAAASGSGEASSGAPSGDPAASGSDTAVTVPSGSAATPASDAPASDTAASGTPSSEASPASSSAASPAPFATIDPLKVDCATLLNAADVKRVFNVDIPTDRNRIVEEANPDRGTTGRVRCLYGLSDGGKTGAVVLAMTQYTDLAALETQVTRTRLSETDLGAKLVETTVQAYPASILIREGGLLVLPYATWTLSVNVNASFDPAVTETGLPQLADSVLTRLLKA